MHTALPQRAEVLDAPKRWKLWTGRVLGILPSLMMAASASMKLGHSPKFVGLWTDHLGFPADTLVPIGVLELLCVTLFLVPRTAILGAVLLTGYLGGVVVTHVRISEPFVVPLVLGVMFWTSLYLRDARVRALSPLDRPREASKG